MKMYKAEFGGNFPKITSVQIEKESKEFVWIKGESYRQLKRGEFRAFFKSYEIAFNFLNDKFAYKAKIAKEEYENFLETIPKIEP